MRFVSAPLSRPHGRAALSSGAISAVLRPRIRTSAWSGAFGRLHSSSAFLRNDATALPAAAPATISHDFTRMVRPSDELGHRSYPRLLPESTAAFHREHAAPLLRAAFVLTPAPTAFLCLRPSMTPIRIDRCLQSTYLFFKDEDPCVSAHSVVALLGRDSAAVVSHRHAGFGGPGELAGALSSPTSRFRASL